MANAFLNSGSTWGDEISTLGRPVLVPRPEGATVDAGKSNAVARKPKAVAWVKMAPDILRAMGLAANHAGRSAGDIWAEAAREWLLRRSLEADYDALSNMPQRRRDGTTHEEMHARLWNTIDTAMSDIRQTRPTL